jgi:hypothetical protein
MTMDTTIIRTKSKLPYLLGFLCLIPLVGAFVGLDLLLYGLIRYKDKWDLTNAIKHFGKKYRVL